MSSLVQLFVFVLTAICQNIYLNEASTILDPWHVYPVFQGFVMTNSLSIISLTILSSGIALQSWNPQFIRMRYLQEHIARTYLRGPYATPIFFALKISVALPESCKRVRLLGVGCKVSP